MSERYAIRRSDINLEIAAIVDTTTGRDVIHVSPSERSTENIGAVVRLMNMGVESIPAPPRQLTLSLDG